MNGEPTAPGDVALAGLAVARGWLAPGEPPSRLTAAQRATLEADRGLAAKLLAGPLLRPGELLDTTPTRVGRYEIERLLGEGASGRVYLARDPELQRSIAIKLLDRMAPRDLDRFRREMEVLAAVQHPGIVTIFDSGLHEGQPYFAMEYAGDRVLEPASLERRELVTQLRDVALACDAAHRLGIVHRDLKPGNIIVGSRPMVADFGVARVHATDLTSTGQVLGTPHYMSPEQASGEAVDARCDVYALGVILYEGLSGGLPFEGRTLASLVQKILLEPPQALRERVADLPRDLEAVVQTALAKAPADRYPTARALADDLSAWLDGQPVSVRLPGWPGRLWGAVRRRPRQVVVGGLLVALLVGSGWLLARIGRPDEGPPARAEPRRAPTAVSEPAPAPARLADIERAIVHQLLALERWEATLYRKTPVLSQRALVAAATAIREALEAADVPPSLRQLGLFGLARAELHIGRTATADRLFAQAIALGPGERLGECHFERARIAWRAMIRVSLAQDKTRAAVLRAEAGGHLRRAREAGLRDRWLRVLAGALETLAEDPKGRLRATLKTLDELRQAEERPVEEVAKLSADLFLISGDAAQAQRHYAWAIERRYHYLQARNGLALAQLFARGGARSIEQALTTAFETIRLNPRHEDSYFVVNLLCRTVLAWSVEQVRGLLTALPPRVIEQALGVLEAGCRRLPESALVRRSYGTVCVLDAFQRQARGQDSRAAIARALRVLDEAHALEEGALQTLIALGMVRLLEVSRDKLHAGVPMERAREVLERAFQKAPQHPAVLRWLGYQRYLARDYSGAARVWQAAARQSPALAKELERLIGEARKRAGG